MPNRPFIFCRSVPEEYQDIPGIWRNKNGSGYRVPLNTHPVIGWPAPHSLATDTEVSVALNSPGLVSDLREFAKEHQKAMLRKALAVSGSHCWAPPGAGKTLVGLVYAIATAPEGIKLIITKAAARGTWAEQCERYTKLTPVLLTGQSPGDVPLSPRNLYITAWETIKYWCPAILLMKPSVIVWDEIHWLRRPKHTKATVMQDGSVLYEGLGNSLDSARQIANITERKLGLTATPIPGRVKDLWTQLDLVEPWQWGTFYQFGMRYCEGRHNGYGYEYNGLSNPVELRDRLRYIKCRVTREEVNKHLPKKRREVVRLSLDQIPRLQDRTVAGLMLGPFANPLPVRFKVSNLRNIASEHEGDLIEADDDTIPLYALAAGPLRGMGLRYHQQLAEAVAGLATA